MEEAEMALRDKLRINAQPLLEPGESIQSIFCAQTVSAYLALVSIWIIIFSNAYRVVVVTDRRILVCQSGRFRMSPVKGVEREAPRQIQIGPAHGLWYETGALGRRLYIHKRFHKDVAEADAAIGVAPPQ
jgi:hypothetical protein